jgi:hypothetical protein
VRKDKSLGNEGFMAFDLGVHTRMMEKFSLSGFNLFCALLSLWNVYSTPLFTVTMEELIVKSDLATLSLSVGQPTDNRNQTYNSRHGVQSWLTATMFQALADYLLGIRDDARLPIPQCSPCVN